MTPVSLNPPPANSPYPLSDQIQDQPLFISPNNQPSSSLSCRTFFNNILDQRQTRSQIGDLQRYQEGDKPVLHDGSSNYQAFSNSDQPVMDDLSNVYGHNPSLCKMEDEESKSSYGYGSSKWMSSKMRLMRKMMTPDSSASSNITPTFQNQQHAENSQRYPSNTNRVCSDCNTISTPLWRSGPKGPKSLCNACGIRQRKARRAMAEAAAAANGLVTSMDASSSTITKTRAHNKEKKSRTNHFAQFKNKSKSSGAGTSQGGRKLGFKDFAISFSNNSAFQQMFPRDEVAEAALLLMELSCGFVHI